MNRETKREPAIIEDIFEPSKSSTEESSTETAPIKEPEPASPAVPKYEDWRMNREWCLNQALDIVKSLKLEVKDVPGVLEKVYLKIVELADDARR